MVLGIVVPLSNMVIASAPTNPAAAAANAGGATSLNIGDEYGVPWNCQFNPYNASDEFDSFGPVYEELAYENSLKNGATTPWLATSWAWSNHNKTLIFTIRKAVTWTDGRPFTANDVLFTFDLLKKNPGLDLNSDWSVLTSVAVKGGDDVVFDLKTAAVPYFYYIADQTPIVPAHIWSGLKAPVSFPDPHPVGTGPYVMSSCSGADIQYTKNTHYWQRGLPKIEIVNFPSYLSNTAANEDLRSATDQWGSQFVPNIQRYYISNNQKYYHYWFAPVYNVLLWVNLTNPVLSDVAVREAMAYAINRPQVSKIGEYGYEPPSNQTGIVEPTFSSWYDASLAGKYGNAYAYNPSRAISILEHAGYKRDAKGIFEKGGKPLSFTIINNGGFSDWVASVNVVQSDLKAVGIQVTPQNLSDTNFLSDVEDGHFELAYDWDSSGPGPYYELRQLLYSPNTAPIGTAAASNFERYSSKSTDALIDQYAATTNSAVQHRVVDELEHVMLSDVPVIPVTEQVDWYQYDTQYIGGWVTSSNPYAQPAQYIQPDWGVVLLHLYYK
jgi:peptide/nickel transport system substrate-binding protein